MTCVVKLYGFVPLSTDGMYLRAYDPEAHHGRGHVEFTAKRAEALTFPDAAAAILLWRAVPHCHPRRDDGKPNRPLTAYHMEIEGAHE